MIALALLLAGSAVPQSFLDKADAAGLAQTQCLFSAFRAANAAHLSPADFGIKLRTACSAESQQLRRLSARIFTLRGQSDPTAEADRLIEDSYSSMVEEYRRFPETEKKMRNFCKTDPTCS